MGSKNYLPQHQLHILHQPVKQRVLLTAPVRGNDCPHYFCYPVAHVVFIDCKLTVVF